MGLLVEAAQGSFNGKHGPRPAELSISKDVVRVRREVFGLKSAAHEVLRVLAEALQSLRYRQRARLAVDHAVLCERNPVPQREIGLDKVCKSTADLVASYMNYPEKGKSTHRSASCDILTVKRREYEDQDVSG